MIVLAETNFVLEVVFGRGKFNSCLKLIEMAEAGVISLLLPAYSIIEPYEAIIRRRKERVRAYDTLTREVKEITRSAQFEESGKKLAELTSLLIEVGETEQNELRNVISRLITVASVVELNASILQRSLALQDELSLSPQDAVVFATVLTTLAERGGPACFMTTNSRDFSSPDIIEELVSYNCKLIFDFEKGLNYVRNKLAKGVPPAS